MAGVRSLVAIKEGPTFTARNVVKMTRSLHAFSQGGLGTEPELETGTVGTVFPETERGTGTVGTVFQEPKPEPEPSLYVNPY